MKRYRWVITAALLACAWLPLSLPPAQAQIGGMTCIECHGDPLNGGFHGGFRSLGGLSDAEMEIVCLSCHDGSYTNPQGILAPEAAVHQNNNPGEGRDEYGDFKASCLDCHTNHSSPFTSLLAGDGTTSIVTISPTPDPDVDEAHDIEPTTVSFLLDEGSIILSAAHPIEIVDDTGGITYVEGVDYLVETIGGDPRSIRILPGGAIDTAAPLTVFAHNYEFAANQQLLGIRNSTDGLARIRKPIIVDPNGDNNGGGNQRFEDDFQNGWECSSGVPDDPTCLADDVRELVFHDQITENGTNWVPTIVTFNPVVTSAPRNGACNSCHTRASHHRRNDLGEYGGGDDHEHNIDKPCDQCHNHKDGWVNKGG
jgi:hypothetical protein